MPVYPALVRMVSPEMRVTSAKMAVTGEREVRAIVWCQPVPVVRVERVVLAMGCYRRVMEEWGVKVELHSAAMCRVERAVRVVPEEMLLHRVPTGAMVEAGVRVVRAMPGAPTPMGATVGQVAPAELGAGDSFPAIFRVTEAMVVPEAWVEIRAVAIPMEATGRMVDRQVRVGLAVASPEIPVMGAMRALKTRVATHRRPNRATVALRHLRPRHPGPMARLRERPVAQ